MAVRHGYGKIAGADALLVAYDTGDTRNSYRGEPTTNLLPAGVAGVHAAASGNAVTVTDATSEKGPGWKKVTITARGTNFRTLQWTYISMSSNTLYCHSAVFDWGNMRGKNYFIYFDGDGTGTRTYYRPGDYVNAGSELINSTMPDGKFAGTITHTGNHTHAFFIGNYTTSVSGLNDYFYYKEFQVEVNSHPTQYTGGTRSATQGLLDLTGNVTIDLSPSGFDSNAKPYFDGVSERIAIGDPGYPSSGTDPFTLEIIYRVPTGATWYNQGSGTGFIGRGSYGGSMGIFRGGTDGQVVFWVRLDGGNIYDPAVTGLTRDVYHHIVGTFDGTDTAKIYHNGQYITQEVNANNAGTLDAGGFNVGGGTSFGGSNGGYGEGEVPVVKLYNRVLTAQEVLNNFNFYKGRFGI